MKKDNVTQSFTTRRSRLLHWFWLGRRHTCVAAMFTLILAHLLIRRQWDIQTDLSTHSDPTAIQPPPCKTSFCVMKAPILLKLQRKTFPQMHSWRRVFFLLTTAEYSTYVVSMNCALHLSTAAWRLRCVLIGCPRKKLVGSFHVLHRWI